MALYSKGMLEEAIEVLEYLYDIVSDEKSRNGVRRLMNEIEEEIRLNDESE
jgi:hypothetical protein